MSLISPSLCLSWSSSPLMPGPPPDPASLPIPDLSSSSSFLVAASSSLLTSPRTASSCELASVGRPGPTPSQYFNSFSH